ncbi:HEPN domain-containing protein [Chlorobium sp. N1]|uniref:HEPN domain-containing protein n=1 Tax=Chlorobium sp. N1 TaxID=2491138 RepID=UPI0010400A84|nr:HEPN domain-containing protein [Chlorobium sp. N1]TCD47585.1 HEPN domain-containing protein [Chlorobium sp. N1]
MDVGKDVRYRLDLAKGFMQEAEQDFGLGRWRSCTYGSDLAVENAGIAVLMLFGVSPSTHKPAMHLSHLLSEGTLEAAAAELIEELLPMCERHESHEKMLAKYGDEAGYRLPWELFEEKDGSAALEDAQKTVRIASELAAIVPAKE